MYRIQLLDNNQSLNVELHMYIKTLRLTRARNEEKMRHAWGFACMIIQFKVLKLQRIFMPFYPLGNTCIRNMIWFKGFVLSRKIKSDNGLGSEPLPRIAISHSCFESQLVNSHFIILYIQRHVFIMGMRGINFIKIHNVYLF